MAKSGERRIRKGGVRTSRGFLFEITGGHLALDFANTVTERKTEDPEELLPEYEDLLSWARQVELVTKADEQRLRREATRTPASARRVHRQALELREVIFNLFRAVAEGRRPGDGDLERLQTFVGRALKRRRLVRHGHGVRWEWISERDDLDTILWPIALGASELLTSEEMARVRVCDGDSCAWLFMDRSRKGNRRWCDMTVCGNREKARRHYERIRRPR